MKPFLASVLLLATSLGFAQDQLLFKSEFRPASLSVKVQGSTEIHRTAEGKDFVSVQNFKLKGGIVLDLKVCGEVTPNERACMSIGEPRLAKQSWEIPYSFYSYEKVVIFDLDLSQDLAVAK
jgi:hypothetical protein